MGGFGGGAGVSLNVNYEPTGGLTLSGASDFNFGTSIDDFLIVSLGSAEVDFALSHSSAGGLTLGGNVGSPQSPIFDDFLIVILDSAPAQLNLNYLSEGGLTANGSAVAEFDSQNVVVGGLVVNGSADIEFGIFADNFLVITLGSADVSLSLTYIAIGSLNLSGQDIESVTFNYIPTGGLDVSGEAALDSQKTFTATGGLTLNGTANVSVDYNYNITGGLTINGTAGLTASNFTFIASGSGGAITGGAVVALSTQDAVGDGGLTINGESNVDFTLSHIATGGLTISGESVVPADFVYIATGGLIIGGSAEDVQIQYAYISTGGLVLNGSALATINLPFIANGGLILGGEASVEIILLHNVDGGLIIGGSAEDVQVQYAYISTGGLILNGEVDVEFTPTIGGVVVGGESLVEFILAIESTGGLVIGGGALTETSLTIDIEFTWEVGNPRFFWWRFEGVCKSRNCPPFGEENLATPTPDDCLSSYVATVLARNLSEACAKLQNTDTHNFTPWQVKNVKRFTRPARREDFEALPEDDPARECNELIDVTPEPKDLPEECIGLFVEDDLEVEIKATATAAEHLGTLGTSGGLSVGGLATIGSGTTPDIVLNGDANVSFSTSSADFIHTTTGGIELNGNIGTFDLDVFADSVIETEDESGSFVADPLPLFTPSVPEIAVQCCNVSFPAQIYLATSDLARTNKLNAFALRSGIDIGNSFLMTYNNVSSAWQYNASYRNDITQERFDLVFEFACINQFSITSIEAAIWKFSMKIENKNPITGNDFVSRMLIIYNNSDVCPNNAINFVAEIDTALQISIPSSAQDIVLSDDIGLFKSRSWINNPIFEINLSQVVPTDEANEVPIDGLRIPIA